MRVHYNVQGVCICCDVRVGPTHIGQHDDARMNLAIALTAIREGATMTNHVEVLSLIKENVRDPQAFWKFSSQLALFSSYHHSRQII